MKPHFLKKKNTPIFSQLRRVTGATFDWFLNFPGTLTYSALQLAGVGSDPTHRAMRLLALTPPIPYKVFSHHHPDNLHL